MIKISELPRVSLRKIGKGPLRMRASYDENKDMLIIRLYYPSGDIYQIIFIEKDDYITYRVKDDKYSRALIDNLNYSSLQDYSEKDLKLVQWFCGRYNEHCICDTIYYTIYYYEKSIFDSRYEKKIMKRQQKVNDAMLDVKDISKKKNEWIRENAFDTYFFMEKEKAYCTKCKSEIDKYEAVAKNEGPLVHNDKCVCPMCGADVIVKYSGYGRKSLTSHEWVQIIEPYREGAIIRFFRVFRKLNDYRNPEINIEELYRIIFDEKERMYEYSWYGKGYVYYGWNDITSRNKLSYAITNQNKICPYIDLKNTRFQYSGLKDYLKSKKDSIGRWDAYRYLVAYNQYPQLESLQKQGYQKIVDEMVNCQSIRSEFDSAQMETHKFFRINKATNNILIDIYSKKDIDSHIIECAKVLENNNLQINRLSILYLKSNSSRTILNAVENTGFSFKKTFNYLLENNISALDYKDHIEMIRELGYPVKEYAFPRRFAEEHERVTREKEAIQEKLEKKEDAIVTKILKKLKSKYHTILENEKYEIIIPDSATSIKSEGRQLHHCVGTYIPKISRGNTLIFFVRNKAQPDMPLYTMEHRKELIQIRAKYNTRPEEDVFPLVDKFTKLMSKEYENMHEIQMQIVNTEREKLKNGISPDNFKRVS